MTDFIIEGEIIELIPLNAAGIEERVIWNTTVIEWKTEESGMIKAQSVDKNSYRLKKEREINSNKKFVDGIYTSLEIYTLNHQHIGFINCYAEYLFKSGIRELTLITRAENKAMQAVGEKCGFHKYMVLSDGRMILSKAERN